jgi:hypothetical protein
MHANKYHHWKRRARHLGRWGLAGLALASTSLAAELATSMSQPSPERPQGMRVIAVGVNQPIPSLSNHLASAELDAAAMAAWFGAIPGVAVSHLSGAAATKEAVRAAIQGADGPPPGDLLFFFSGYNEGGALLSAGAAFQEVGAHRQLDPATVIGGDELSQWIADSRALRVWLMLDFSRGDTALCAPAALAQRLAAPDAALYVFCAAVPGLSPLDTPQGGHYTKRLLAGLKGAADRDSNGAVSAYELAAYLAGDSGAEAAKTPPPATYLQGWDHALPKPPAPAARIEDDLTAVIAAAQAGQDWRALAATRGVLVDGDLVRVKLAATSPAAAVALEPVIIQANGEVVSRFEEVLFVRVPPAAIAALGAHTDLKALSATRVAATPLQQP